MNWDALGSIGELLSALGVLASLIYLAVQIRSTKSAMTLSLEFHESVSRADSQDKIVQQRNLIASNRELAELWNEGSKGGGLDEIDALRYRNLVVNFVTIRIQGFRQAQYSGDEDYMNVVSNHMAQALKHSPGFEQLYQELFGGYVRTQMPEFDTRIKQRMEALGSKGTNE